MNRVKIERELKIALLTSLSDGYFDEQTITLIKQALNIEGKEITIEIIDRREQVNKTEYGENSN